MSNSTSSTFTFSRPVSPTKEKDALKPNPHPYAIKTTSTALLSRSNSSPQPQGPAPRHYYVPTSPSPNNATLSRNSPSPTRSLNGHRYSKSLTSDNPRPLPIPPSFSASPTKSNPFETPSRTRTKRADTLPSIPTSAAEELPENPKQWTPSQLSTYLTTALRIKSGEALDLPLPVAKDIAAFVRESRITGKSFLRFNEDDLEGYGVNKLWRTALLAASRNLRQSVLRGRIWGLGSGLGSQDEDDDDIDDHDDGTPNNNRRRDPMYASESSSTESFHSASSSSSIGRVRGMVANFERSASNDDLTAQISRSRSGSSSGILEDGGFYEPYSTRVLQRLEDEPSMESLIAARKEDSEEALLGETVKLGGSGGKRKGGVYNWETEKGLGITIKHVGGERRGVGEIFGADGVDADTAVDEKKIESELEETRSLIEAFRVRLEEVEKKVGEMEEREREREEAENRKREEALKRAEQEEAARKAETEALTRISKDTEEGRRHWNNGLVGLLLRSKPGSAVMGALEYVSGFARIGEDDSEAQRKRDSRVKRTATSHSDPKTVSALPSYVLLVGLGVCVVVLRVMLRRAIGSGRRR